MEFFKNLNVMNSYMEIFWDANSDMFLIQSADKCVWTSEKQRALQFLINSGWIDVFRCCLSNCKIINIVKELPLKQLILLIIFCQSVKQDKWKITPCFLPKSFTKLTDKGSFTNYVDKKRWVGGQKMSTFCQHRGVGGQKKENFFLST